MANRKRNYKEIKNARTHIYTMLDADHKARMIIRKLDSSASRIKDFNQKNPSNKQLIPNSKLHKLLV